MQSPDPLVEVETSPDGRYVRVSYLVTRAVSPIHLCCSLTSILDVALIKMYGWLMILKPEVKLPGIRYILNS
jgi:hypothetical protein